MTMQQEEGLELRPRRMKIRVSDIQNRFRRERGGAGVDRIITPHTVLRVTHG